MWAEQVSITVRRIYMKAAAVESMILVSILNGGKLCVRNTAWTCHAPTLQEFASLLEKLSLKSLSLLSCRLSTAPHPVTYHCSLHTLVIRDCFLTKLANGPYLKYLRRLDLCGNDFFMIPSEALGASSLEALSMIGKRTCTCLVKVPRRETNLRGERKVSASASSRDTTPFW